MKKFLVVSLLVALSLTGLPASGSKYKYQPVGVPARAASGLTITVDSMELIEKSGSVQLVVTYTQKNNSSTKKIDEGAFKLFFTDGSSEPQYGFFGSFFPGDGNTRTYTWEWLKKKKPLLIEWDAGFFTRKPTSKGLKWKVENSIAAPSPSPTEAPTQAPTETPTPTPTQTSTPSPSPTESAVPVELPTSFNKLNTNVRTSTGLVIRASSLTLATGASGAPEVDFKYRYSTTVTSRKVTPGFFSLHFDNQPPSLIDKSVFNLRPRQPYSEAILWAAIEVNATPLYVQWNPTATILEPSAKTPRWEIPK